MSKKYIYEVPITIKSNGTFSVIARSEEEAKKIAENECYVSGNVTIPTAVENNEKIDNWDIQYLDQSIGNPGARICSYCNCGMNKGYIIDESSETYCSEKCFQKDKPNDYKDYIKGEDIFYTDWEPEEYISPNKCWGCGEDSKITCTCNKNE